MPEIVQFTAPGTVELVETDAAPLVPGSVRIAHLVLGHLGRHRADRLPGNEPVPRPRRGTRSAACSCRVSRASGTPCRDGATPRSARSSRSPTTSTTSASATSSTASGATAATRSYRHPPSPGGSCRADVDPVLGTFARVGSIALNAVLAADVRLGEQVAIFGQGVIGLLATRLATLLGRPRARGRHASRDAWRSPPRSARPR